MHVVAVRSPLSFVLALAAFVASALPQTAQAGDKYLQMLTAEERESVPAQRYARMSREEAIEELERRGVSFVEVPEDKARGVMAPVRLTDRINGLLVHGSGNDAQQATSPFEILDARLALTLYDFADILARHDIDEVVHYTMYRPGVAGYSTVKKIPLSQFKASGGRLDDKSVVIVPAPPRPKGVQRPNRTASSKATTTRRGTAVPHSDDKQEDAKAAAKDAKPAAEPKADAKLAAKVDPKADAKKSADEKKAPAAEAKKTDDDKLAAKADAKKPDAKPAEQAAAGAAKKSDEKPSPKDEKPGAKLAAKVDPKADAKDAKSATKADAKDDKLAAKPDAKLDAKTDAKDAKSAAKSTPKADAKADEKLTAKDAKPDAKLDAKSATKADAKDDKLAAKDAKSAAKPDTKADEKLDTKADEKLTAKPDTKSATKADAKDTKSAARDVARDVKSAAKEAAASESDEAEEEAYVYVNVPKPSEGQTTSRHPAGLAIDVAILKKKNGTQLNVAKHFAGRIGQQTCGAGAPQPQADEARELLSIVCEASDARLFSYVLTPNFNQAHRDHFHMEIKSGTPWMLVH